MNKQLGDLALQNFEDLRNNPYPGRGIVIGMNRFGTFIQVYWIMGRSENSRNRVFVKDEDGTVRTEPFDADKVEDPSLIIYAAMIEHNGMYAVSNGNQTQDVVYPRQKNLHEALSNWEYEPDEPNFTPRITAIYDTRDNVNNVEISILKRSIFGRHGCDRQLYHYNANAFDLGFGYCVTTYDGDGEPLPAFSRVPYLLPLNQRGIEAIAESYWQHLNEDNRVALVVKRISKTGNQSEIFIINKHQRQEAAA